MYKYIYAYKLVIDNNRNFTLSQTYSHKVLFQNTNVRLDLAETGCSGFLDSLRLALLWFTINTRSRTMGFGSLAGNLQGFC